MSNDELPEEISKYIQDLRNPDINRQVNAANSLGASCRTEAVEPLLNRLRRPDNINVRVHIINALGQLKDERAIERLTHMTIDSNPQVRSAAVAALGKIGKKKTINSIVERLNDPAQSVQISAINAFGDMRAPRAVEHLIKCLNDPALVVHASNILKTFKDKKVIKPLSDALVKNPPQVRPQIALALVEFGIDIEETLVPLLSPTSDPNILIHVASMLGRVKSKKAIKPLIELFAHSDASVQASASTALSNIPESIEPLVERFQEEPANQNIVNALVGLGKISISPLKKLKSEATNEAIRSQASVILTQILEKYLPLITSPDTKTKIEASEVFSLIVDKRTVDPLVKVLSDTDGNVRMSAIHALRMIGDPKAIEPLKNALIEEEEVQVRVEGIKALGEFGGSVVIETLIRETRNRRSPKIRAAAVIALGRVKGGERDVKASPIIERLDDPDAVVKIKAIEQLINIADKRAIEPLKKMREYPLEEIRKKAVEALESLLGKYLKDIQDKTANEDDLRYAIEALGLLGDAKVVDPLLTIVKDNPIVRIRAEAAKALGAVGDERLLEPLKNIRQRETNENVSKAIDGAIETIEGKQVELPSAIDKLRLGHIELTPVQVLKVIKDAKHSFSGEIANDIKRKLDKAILHYRNGAYSDHITRINSACEALLKALYVVRKDDFRLDGGKFDRLMKGDHANRIGKLKDVFGEALYAEFMTVHQRRVQADAAHAGGKPMTPADANLVTQLFRSIYFRVEELIKEVSTQPNPI